MLFEHILFKICKTMDNNFKQYLLITERQQLPDAFRVEYVNSTSNGHLLVNLNRVTDTGFNEEIVAGPNIQERNLKLRTHANALVAKGIPLIVQISVPLYIMNGTQLQVTAGMMSTGTIIEFM